MKTTPFKKNMLGLWFGLDLVQITGLKNCSHLVYLATIIIDLKCYSLLILIPQEAIFSTQVYSSQELCRQGRGCSHM